MVQHCHANEWLHRDIKPDNIILKGGDPAKPVLLDFGIAYKDGIIEGFETDYAQELGNRFLRLSEMSAGSAAKQDKRTDIAFLGGIFYYLLTGLAASTLADGDGRMPHQRAASVETLRMVFNGPPATLFDFFDRTFSQRLSGRFVGTKEMNVSLMELIDMHEKGKPNDNEPSLDDVVASLNTKVGQDLAKNKVLYDLAMSRITHIHGIILQRINPIYTLYQTGYLDFTGGLRNDLGFAHFATHDHRFVPQFLIHILGDEPSSWQTGFRSTGPKRTHRNSRRSLVKPSRSFTSLDLKIWLIIRHVKRDPLRRLPNAFPGSLFVDPKFQEVSPVRLFR